MSYIGVILYQFKCNKAVIPAGVLIHELEEVVSIDVPPSVHWLGEDLHSVRELGEMVQECCLPTADISLHHDSKGSGLLHSERSQSSQ